jgi:polar amino acid transport system substrate-binding protein
MKKILFIALAVLILTALILSSCGGSGTTAAAKKYTIATDATWAPFEYVDTDTNQIVGFDIDLFNAIAQKENIKFEYVNVAFDPLLAGVAQGTYDAAISSITINDERKKEMLFSDPYYAAGQIVVVGINNNTIKGKETLTGKVGAQLGTTGADAVAAIPGAELKTYDEIGLAFQDLMNGQINAVVCDNPVAAGYVVKNADKLKYAGKTFTDESYGIAISKGNTELQKKINAGLKAVLGEGLIKKLEDKWYKQ